jgi:hypothetical protein
VDSNLSRLRIAARIHFFLKRELGIGIDVERMLKRASYAGEVLALCDSVKGSELAQLAQQFRAATLARDAASHRHAMPWAEDTSGFGLSRPLETGTPGADKADDTPADSATSRSWFSPARWLNR